MSASLLHEISNPLTAALLNLELSDEKSPTVRRAQRDMRLLRRYVEAARQQVRYQSRTTNFSLLPQVEQLKRVLLPLARKAGVQLTVNAAAPCRLRGDPVKLQHIMSNLVVNAIQAYEASQLPGGRVDMICEVKDNWLTIRVTDWAAGIPDEALPHVFEAFYSTKTASGHGLGIGLAIVKRYVTADFGGDITVASRPQDGTCFTVRLPCLPPSTS